MCDEELLRESAIKRSKVKNKEVFTVLPDDCVKSSNRQTKIIISVLVVIFFLSAITGYIILKRKRNVNQSDSDPSDPVEPLPPSESRIHIFQRAAVCTDAPRCSQIGRDILLKNGSAVDAAIASMFCNGVLNQVSMGLGGGFFMTVYIKEENKAYTVIAREKAPAAATVEFYDGKFSNASNGPLSSGVPGELRGMWAAHKRWGKLTWSSLIAPTLQMCEDGFPMSKAVYDRTILVPYIKNDANLAKMYYNFSKGAIYEPGTIVKPVEALCKTFKRIAENGGDDLYNGSLSVDFLEDLKNAGSIITAEDLKNYEAKITESLAVSLGDGDTLYTSPPPSSGIILVNILNILSGFNFNSTSINTTDNEILTYHRILEAFKYSFATRTKLGDPDFLDLKELIFNVTKPDYNKKIRLKINDTTTTNNTDTYGASEFNKPDHGTAHISIIGNNGDAVSVTSSINKYFGAGFSTLNTGIVMNNVMDDFSFPGIINHFGLKPSQANLIAPNKRPMSSMSPSIIVDKKGNAKLVIGAAGGTKIVTSVALVTMRKLWFGQTIKEAVDAPRIHHQIFPVDAEYEYGNTKDIVKGLKEKGHGMIRYSNRMSVVCAIYQNETGIYANADFRKNGDVSGID